MSSVECVRGYTRNAVNAIGGEYRGRLETKERGLEGLLGWYQDSALGMADLRKSFKMRLRRLSKKARV